MIDREKVIKGLECHADRTNLSCRPSKCPYFAFDFCGPLLATDALELLKEQETVVRCKDCKHVCLCDAEEMFPDMPVYAKCTLSDEVHEPDWYCADGERKEGGQ